MSANNNKHESISFSSQRSQSCKIQIGSPVYATFKDAAHLAVPATVKLKSFFPQDAPVRVPKIYFEFFNKEFVGPYTISDKSEIKTGIASGVLISEDGYILQDDSVNSP